ncbi:MAG: hypothetical protein GY865_07795 [candidate division Zixibacteria bacterium]|nr:hypothetical protein [candidate division Zixibacteria bacterium]
MSISEIKEGKKLSKKQKIANRENGKKSNGPKTANGKNIVKNNAVKHGFYSDSILINSPHLKENKEEYDYLLDCLIAELEPQTQYQFILVQKIVNCLWRSRRIINAETSQINRQLRKVDSSLKYEAYGEPQLGPDELEDVDSARIRMEETFQKRADMVGVKSIPDDHFCVRILHYEMRLDRQQSRAYLQLRLLQTKCISEPETEINQLKEAPIADPPESASIG